METTTGPLGQGFANGVGMAMAEAHLAAGYNRPGHKIVDHYIYAIVTDGDLMEGVTSEAASLAGHLRLGKLIYLYDDNHISHRRPHRHRLHRRPGQALRGLWLARAAALRRQRSRRDRRGHPGRQARPAPLDHHACRTIIGYGLPTTPGTSKAHGEPLGEAELNGAKEKLGWPMEPRFYIPDDALAFFRQAVGARRSWKPSGRTKFEAYRRPYRRAGRRTRAPPGGLLPEDWTAALPVFPLTGKAWRHAPPPARCSTPSADTLPELIGGSADLAPSTKTWHE